MCLNQPCVHTVFTFVLTLRGAINLKHDLKAMGYFFFPEQMHSLARVLLCDSD